MDQPTVDAGACTAAEFSNATDPEAQRDQALARWEARGPTHYRLIWSTSAMVGQTQVAVEVRGHRVVSTTVLHGPELAARSGHAGGTVEDLFTELRNAQQTADAVTVAYDPGLCYPTQVQIDQKRNATDDEHSFAVEELRPLPP